MPTLTELVTERADLREPEVEHIHRLLGSWQLIADLSFADLALWCLLSDGDGFVCVGQMRPYTAQTLHPEDLFGHVVRPEELPVIDRSYHEGRSWQRDEPVLIDGVPVRMEAVPVKVADKVVAVMTKEGAPLTHRRPGQLEQNYLACSAALSLMVEEESFPFAREALDPETSPRVGDGMIRLDSSGMALYASPNAISAYRRLGIVSNIEGEIFAELGIDAAPALLALQHGIPAEADAEVERSVVLQRALPFLKGPSREVVGTLLLVRDVTELRHRERQIQMKEAAIREIHHRVKNNLQTIASLLRLQARRLDSEAKLELDQAVRRIATIALVHETLSKESGQWVEFADVASGLARMVAEGLIHPDSKVSINVEGDPGKMPADIATPLAVVLVELLQNAVEHAFGEGSGTVLVEMSRSDGRIHLVVSDDGCGLPAGFSLDDAGLGLQIVKTLVETELEGKLTLDGSVGTHVKLDIPARRRAGLRP